MGDKMLTRHLYKSIYICNLVHVYVLCILKDPKTDNRSITMEDQVHNSLNMITTGRQSSDNGKLPCREEHTRKSPPTTLFHQQRPFPYSTRGSLRKVLLLFIYHCAEFFSFSDNYLYLVGEKLSYCSLIVYAGDRKSKDKPCTA